MAQLLTLSKAAKLVGVKRDTLQSQIRQGELKTFEGLLDLDELLKLYPQTQVEDSAMIERVSHIKANAINKLRESSDLDNSHIFGAKITELRQQLALYQKKQQTTYSLLCQLRMLCLENKNAESENYLNLIDKSINALTHHAQELLSAQSAKQISVNTHVVRLSPGDHEFIIVENETILDTALKYGMNIQYACSDGTCGKCKAQTTYGMSKQVRYHECQLSPAEKSQGYIYTCAYTALTDIELITAIAKTNDDIQTQTINGIIKQISHNAQTTVLTIKTPAKQRFRFLAGQQIKLILKNQKHYQLPIANCPCEDRIVQLHLPWQQQEKNNEFHALKPGEAITIQGPFGDFILNIDSHKPIIFIAYKTGFSALKSLIEQAISLETLDSIYFFWIANNDKALYFNNLCRAWMDAFDNFHYLPILIEAQEEPQNPQATQTEQFQIQTALEYIDNSISNLSMFQFYLATPEAMTSISRDFLNARGVADSQILTTNIDN